jgi:predicted dehydrogenase
VQGLFQILPEVQCVAVCDPIEPRIKRRATAIDEYYSKERQVADYKGCASYRDFRELLARQDLDGVVIATPDHWHVPIALEAVRAGKDVYVEKPLGVSFYQDVAMREVVHRYGAVFQYGTQQRSERNFRFACELVRNGKIGKLHTMHTWCAGQTAGGSAQPQPVPGDFDFDLWLGPAPVTPYCPDRVLGTGMFWINDYSLGYIAGWGVHPIDIAQWGNGSDDTTPIEYEGKGIIPTEGLYDTIISWDMTMRYRNGVEMRFLSQELAQPLVETYRKHRDHGTTFIGDKGWISVDRGGIYADPPALLETVLAPEEIHLYESANHQQNFIDCIKTRKPTISTVDAAVTTDTISQLCDISVRLGRKLRWDPDQEKILDDPEAERLLHRPMRAPWTL